MKHGEHILHNVWDQLSGLITTTDVNNLPFHPDDLIASLFCPGPFYYYIVDFYRRSVSHVHPGITSILGLDPNNMGFDDILHRIHPEDMEYVARAEKTVLDYLYNVIGRDQATRYKMSYCFRFRTADDSYQLFQHQAIILSTDDKGGFAQSLNIHTNINHLTTVNNHKVSLMAISESNPVCHQLDVFPGKGVNMLSMFTTREQEIIRLIAHGADNKTIAATLSISVHTVKTHRKNILSRANVHNTSALIARCSSEGLL